MYETKKSLDPSVRDMHTKGRETLVSRGTTLIAIPKMAAHGAL
jgi:hypothetical protein